MAMENQQALPSLDVWTSALLTKSSAGRGGNGKLEAYGIKKLRELILELAVRGKLVAQDPSDESASALLEEISQKKARLNKEGRIRKQEKQPSITDSEKPFYVPVGWEWVRLGDVVEVVRGITFPASEKSRVAEEGRVACLRTTNVQDRIEWDDLLYVRREFVTRDEQFVRASDIVMSTANSRELVGKVAIIEEEPEFQTAFGGFLTVLRPILLDPSFVIVLLRTPVSRNALIDSASQTTNIANISIGKLNPLVLAIPPLAEQQRIVAKVDELMALCDQLEQQQTDSLAAHQTLVETLLGTLTRVESQQEFSAAWARIASHFDTLFTTEASIDQLKQTLLQLAVMGKLVPQDPNDEPASMLLKRIASERTRLVEDGEARQKKVLPDIAEDETPYVLPNGWEWVRLGQIISISSGDGLTSANMKSDGGIPVYGGNGINGYHDKANITKPTLVIGRVGYYCGSIHITPESAWVTDNAFVTIFSEENIYLGFLYWLLRGTNLKENENATAQPVISGRKVYPIVVGLPPKKEQHRIVAKVDELMALCDALKARIKDAQTTQLHLADVIVEQAVC